MSRGDVVNGLWLALALTLSLMGAGFRASPPARPEAASLTLGEGPKRIVSASTIADQLLLALCEPEKIVAFTATSAELAPDRHRFAGRPKLASIDHVEAVIALSPEVVVVSNVADSGRVARLEEAGISVLDLGVPSGLESLRRSIDRIAALCGDASRGARLAADLERRLETIADGVARPRSAVYAVVYGGRIYGGTRGTSYHDVLRFAGLRDAAAADYEGFPQYSVEQLLGMDPELVVTREGMREAICRQPGLEGLGACRDGILEIEGAILDDPGLGMVEAAALVHAAAYPR